jgi:hypothetical protein
MLNRQVRLTIGSAIVSILAVTSPATAAVGWLVTSDGSIGESAVRGATNYDLPLYVCRTRIDAQILPGVMSPVNRRCVVTFNGRIWSQPDYEVLQMSNPRWMPMGRELPGNAVVAAQEIVPGVEGYPPRNIYICRVGYSIGRYHPLTRVCYFPYGGQPSQAGQFFDILVGS